MISALHLSTLTKRVCVCVCVDVQHKYNTCKARFQNITKFLFKFSTLSIYIFLDEFSKNIGGKNSQEKFFDYKYFQIRLRCNNNILNNDVLLCIKVTPLQVRWLKSVIIDTYVSSFDPVLSFWQLFLVLSKKAVN